MNTVHPLGFLPKMFTIKQRSSFNELRPVSLVKLERGLAQRSLLYCLEKGYFSLIHYLLQTGTCNARERDSENRTALMYCCFIEQDSWAQNMAMILLEYGAKVGDEDQRGLNALHYAISTRRLVLVRCYLGSLDFNPSEAMDIHGNTCLHYAASTGDIDIVRLVLMAMKRYRIDLSVKNNAGLTAHDIACQSDNEHCQDLIQSELALSEQNKLSSVPSETTSLTPLIFEPILDRRFSTTSQARSMMSARLRIGTPGAPLFISRTRSLRQPSSNSSTFAGESSASRSSILIDPTESRNIRLRRNKPLDLSLLNQAKSLPSLTPSSSNGQSDAFSASSSTWRDDFTKVFDRFQTLRTPSYRETIHPPLSTQIPIDLYQNIYSVGDTFKHESGGYAQSGLPGLDPSQKSSHRRRSSVVSAKFAPRLRKQTSKD
jgi:ankyrin repeat protein